MISEVLQRATVFDPLDVPNLSSFECLCRRYQVIEEILRPEEPETPIEGMEHIMSRPRLSGCVRMSPDLSRYVAEQLALETSVLKERRKAREERAAKTKAEGGQVMSELGQALNFPGLLDGSSPEAALQELLGPLSSYSGEHVAQAAYEPDLVSLPEVAGDCDLASQLEGPDRDCLVSFEESLLLSEDAFTQRAAEEGAADAPLG